MSKSGLRSVISLKIEAGSVNALICAWRCVFRRVVGLIGLEPMTPALSRRCSNQLSYRPLGRKPQILNSKF